MRIPTHSRQTETDSAASEYPATAAGAASTDTPTDRPGSRYDTPNPPQGGTGTGPTTYRHAEPDAAAVDRGAPDRTMADRGMTDRTMADRNMNDRTMADRNTMADRYSAERTVTDRGMVDETDRRPVIAGPKPRASLLATLGLICGVAAALLVLSGPLLGWGIGVAGLALVLSLGGIHATGRRHVAGKTDALIGMLLALGSIVVGVLALTGSLSWLGTDVQTVSHLREWLDTNVTNRF